MKKIDTLEHPSELKFEIFGSNKEEVFRNAVLAMRHFMKNKRIQYRYKTKLEIELDSIDINSLFVDFLSEILANCHINKTVYTKVSNLKIRDDTHIKAELHGYRVTSFDEDIKAVTYQDVDLRQIDLEGKRIFSTKLVFDI